MAADLSLETPDGPIVLSELWSGCEAFLFIPSDPDQASGWPYDLWARNVDTRGLFSDLPLNTQIFFVSSSLSATAREADFEVLQDGVDSALNRMDDDERAWWQPRVHYLDGRATEQPGWLGDALRSPNWGMAIDRFQRLRYIGSFADPRRYNSAYGWFEPNLSMAANEVVYYNFESDREEALEADGATVVSVFEGDRCAGSVKGVASLPDAESMAGFDTLTVDLTMACEGAGEYGYCPAWDYMAYLFLCDQATEENPYTDTACTPGEDTLVGTCQKPTGESVEASYACSADGKGYEDLACACDTEIGRWITTYHREGRWVYDISAYLPLLSSGGDQQLRFETNGPYELDLDLRLSNQGKLARPAEITYLFAGGTITTGSNDAYEPVVVTIPADAVKVELATVISGHGADSNNCGEFCDMGHYFTINGDESKAIVRDFPEASSSDGCQEQVGEGTVPNQYGTWWYGRAGWCPGKEVPTVMDDITDQIVPGADNTFEYKALFRGAEYDGWSTNRMNAWLVISR